MVQLLLEFGTDVSAVTTETTRENPDETFERTEMPFLSTMAKELGARELLADVLVDGPTTPVVVNGPEYIPQLRLDITKPLRLAISNIRYPVRFKHLRGASLSSVSASAWTMISAG
jgi:hypothetical protein